MPIGTPTECFHAQVGSAASTTYTFSPAVNMAAGTVGVIFARALTTTTVKVLTAVSDPHGNTWTVNATSSQNSNNENLSVASAQIATAILTTDTITLTFSSAASANPAVFAETVTGLATSGAFDQTVAGNGTAGAAGTITDGTTPTLSQASEIVFEIFDGSGVANFSNVGATQWTLTAGSPTNNQYGVAYDIVNATTGVQTAVHVDRALTVYFLAASFKAPSASNIATVTGVAAASVSTVTGLAFASIANIDGIVAP